MARIVTGLGGVFFKAADPKALGAWYQEHLGVDVQEWGGAVFRWTESSGRHARASTVWSPFKVSTTYFDPSTKPYMVNLRVADLDATLASLRAAGVTVGEKIEVEDNGRFGWCMDPEGTRIELWEPAEPRPSGRSIEREAVFPLAPEALFDLLVTPSAIRAWWSAQQAIVMPRAGGIYCATWGGTEDRPEYVTCATIEVLERPKRLVLADFRYMAPLPLPFDTSSLVTEFCVEPAQGGARLSVFQGGFPTDTSADAFYAGCQTGWKSTFEGIVRFVGQR